LHVLLEEKYPKWRVQAMLDIMTAIPSIIHTTTATSSDVAVLIVGLLAAFVLLVNSILWVAAKRSSVQRQSQMKEAEQPYEASPQPKGGEQPQVHAPEEEKVLLRR
jgi:hypothetical protein